MVGDRPAITYCWTCNFHCMQVVGRREAFEAMLQERGVYKKLGVDRSTVAGWKTRLREGKLLSEDKMKEMLFKYGYTIVQDEVWDIDSV